MRWRISGLHARAVPVTITGQPGLVGANARGMNNQTGGWVGLLDQGSHIAQDLAFQVLGTTHW